VEHTRGTILACPQTAKNACTATKKNNRPKHPKANGKPAITGSYCRREAKILQVYEIRHWRKKPCQPIEKHRNALLTQAIVLEAVSDYRILLFAISKILSNMGFRNHHAQKKP